MIILTFRKLAISPVVKSQLSKSQFLSFTILSVKIKITVRIKNKSSS